MQLFSKINKMEIDMSETKISKDVDKAKNPIEKKGRIRNLNMKEIDFSCWPDGFDIDLVEEWLADRESRKIKTTQRSMDCLGHQLTKGVDQGYEINDMIGECIDCGWLGFKVQWFKNNRDYDSTLYNKELVLDQKGNPKNSSSEEIASTGLKFIAGTRVRLSFNDIEAVDFHRRTHEQPNDRILDIDDLNRKLPF